MRFAMPQSIVASPFARRGDRIARGPTSRGARGMPWRPDSGFPVSLSGRLRSLGLWTETDAAPRRDWRPHELADGRDQGADVDVVPRHSPIQLAEFLGQITMRSEQLAQPNESADDEDAHLDGA